VTESDAVFLYDLLDIAQPTEQRALYDAMDAPTRERCRGATDGLGGR
jgi:hypothetical protein